MMSQLDRRLACISLTLLTPLLLGAEPLDRHLQPGLSFTQMRADSPQPAGRPVLVTLVFANATDKPLWLGPFPYVEVNGVGVRITDAQGRVREAALENSHHGPWSGPGRQLAPGQSEGAPAIVPPLPEGKYTLQISDKEVQVTVQDDPQLARKRADWLLAKLRRGKDFFPRFLFYKYPDPAVTDALVKDLLSEDSKTVAIAGDCLWHLRKPPKDAGPVVRQAMKKQMEIIGRQQNRNTWALGALAFLAARIGTDECLAAVLDLAHSDLGGPGIVPLLGGFNQPLAAQELRAFLRAPDQRVRFEAARALARQQDPAAIPVLLEVARHGEDLWPQYAYEELARYPNNPQAEAALKEAGLAASRPGFAVEWGDLGGLAHLLKNPAVQEELKLTGEQVGQIKAIMEQTESDCRERLRQLGIGALPGRRQALREEFYEKMQKTLAPVLTPGQKKRLGQLSLQTLGTEALLRPEVQERLLLSVKQEQKIKAIMAEERQERDDIRDGPQGYPEENQKKLNAVGEQSRQKIMAVLTAAQKKAFREMLGEPFDFHARRQEGRQKGG